MKFVIFPGVPYYTVLYYYIVYERNLVTLILAYANIKTKREVDQVLNIIIAVTLIVESFHIISRYLSIALKNI